jgi:hypothetical protein
MAGTYYNFSGTSCNTSILTQLTTDASNSAPVLGAVYSGYTSGDFYTVTNTGTIGGTPLGIDVDTSVDFVTCPCDCTYYDVIIYQTDLDDATGNTSYPNNTVYISYIDCNGTLQAKSYTNSGTYTNDICVTGTSTPTSFYYKNDSQTVAASFATDTNTSCCTAPTPSPTVSETPTNTPTPTNTETPTNTPTPSPTVSETPTNTPTPTPTLTPGTGPSPTASETPTNTPTPTNTETPTQTPTPTNTGTPTNTPTPTQTSTNTGTPTNTPTQTPTNVSCNPVVGLNVFGTQILGEPALDATVTIQSNVTQDTIFGIEVQTSNYGTLYVYVTITNGNLSGNILDSLGGLGAAPIVTSYCVYSVDNNSISCSLFQCSGGSCPCVDNATPTQTPTNSETPTPTPTPSQTETPTVSPSPTNSQTPTNTPTPTITNSLTPTNTPTTTIIVGVVVQFVDCENGSNIFRFAGSLDSLILGATYYINGGTDFVGCATVVTTDGSGPLYDANGVTFTNTIGCADTLCPRVPKRAALLSKCSDGTLLYAIVDEDVAFLGAAYLYNGECYSFIEFSGPGGPDLGAPDYLNCSFCVATPTPTSTPSTPTPTPTPSSTPDVCDVTCFCLNTSLLSLTGFSGTYCTHGGYYNCYHYYEGGGFQYGIIYYTGQYWCLSTYLGGPCLLRGAEPCFSPCPDLNSSVFTSGVCPPEPTPDINCNTIDFYAYFDCDYVPPVTPIACDFTLDSIATTPTPTPTTQYCNNVAMSFTMSAYTPVNNVTPPPTPSITPTNPISISGLATFEVFQEQFDCVSVKVLIECITGNEYYVTSDLIYNGSPLTPGIFMLASINGIPTCVEYNRDDSNLSSNANVDTVYLIGNSCAICSVSQTPTQTPTITPTVTVTSTQTQTPTNTPTPSQTPTNTPTSGLVPSQTPTNTPTPSPSSSIAATPTQTPTMTKTPTQTPTYVYVYESCSPLQLIPYLPTQIIQTDKLPLVDVIDSSFKDSNGNCWRYVGPVGVNYIPPINVVPTTYQGNYFTTIGATIYDNCNTCINGNPPTGQFILVSQQGVISGLPDGCGGYGATKESFNVQLVDSSGQPVIATSDITVIIELSYSDCLSTSSPTETFNVTILTGESSKLADFTSVDYQPCPYDLRCTPVYRGYNGISQIFPSTITQYVP